MTQGGRHTIERAVSLSGVGLHTGHEVTLTFCPAQAHVGVVFRRTDLDGSPTIPAEAEAVRQTNRRTVLGRGDTTVDTTEHVLAAVAGHQIDDLWINLTGPEPPILDGSAKPFFDELDRAGVMSLGGDPTRFAPPEPLHVQEGSSRYRVSPGSNDITVTLEWDHPCIGRMSGTFSRSPGDFREHLAAARTFGFLAEIDELRKRGLIKGARPGCAVVLSDTAVVSGELRWPDEFVRHKIVDLIGDLVLLGGRLDGSIEAVRPSHAGNVALVRAILDQSSSGA